MLDRLERVEGTHAPVAATGDARTGIAERARRIQMLRARGSQVRQRRRLDVRIAHRPLQLEVGDDAERRKAREVGRVDHFQVRDLVAVAGADNVVRAEHVATPPFRHLSLSFGGSHGDSMGGS